MDYEKFIDENECLQAYFIDFPKKLMQLAKEKNVISFHGHGLLINYANIYDYLMSSDSIFPQCSLMDFFETLQVLQFSRSTHAKKIPDSPADKIFYLFINPNFVEDQEVPDDFYKRPIDITKCNVLKGTKRMTNNHHIGLFQRLLDRASANQLKISKLEYARMRIDYEFQRRDNLIRRQLDVIEHDVNEPQYVKDNEIAGYYGNVSLELLKNSFCNYFPVYQNEAPQPEESNDQETPPEEAPTEKKSEEIIVDIIPSPSKRLHSVPFLADSTSTERKITGESTRKRKYKPRNTESRTRKSARISYKETEDALTNLQKEFDSI